MAWKVVTVRDAQSTPGRDTVSAAVVQVERGSEERSILVELARTAATVGKTLDAREAVSEYLDDDDPPQLLTVTSNGVSPAT